LTVLEHIATLKQAANALKDGQALQRAAQDVHALRVERIFDTGAVARGYSTKPIWIANKEMRGAQNSGKSGTAKKTSYFSGGYKQYKGAVGFDNSKVNFRNTNDLQMDFANSRVNPNTGAADAGIVIKKNNFLFVEEIRRPKNAEKLNGLQKQFGPFLNFTSNEIKVFNDVLELELVSILKGEAR